MFLLESAYGEAATATTALKSFSGPLPFLSSPHISPHVELLARPRSLPPKNPILLGNPPGSGTVTRASLCSQLPFMFIPLLLLCLEISPLSNARHGRPGPALVSEREGLINMQNRGRGRLLEGYVRTSVWLFSTTTTVGIECTRTTQPPPLSLAYISNDASVLPSTRMMSSQE